MARVPVDHVVRSITGAVQEDVEVYIYHRGTTDEADVYDAETGGNLITQPLVSDAEGSFPDRWVAHGLYDRHVPADVTNPTQPWDAGAPITVGLLADRPAAAAHNTGVFFYATDGAGTLYLSDGTDWKTI